MKVSELIDLLRRCDPDLPVKVAYQDETAVPVPPVGLDDVVSVGTDNAPRPRVLIANADMPSLNLPR